MPTLRLRPPGVNVYQIFETEAITIFNAVLSPCIIGPAKQIRVDKAAGVYSGETIQIAYPEKLITSVVNKDSVTIKINAVTGIQPIQRSDILITSTSGETDNGDETIFSDANVDYITAGIATGDILVIMENGNYFTYEIEQVIDATTLKISAGAGTGQSNIDYFIFSKQKYVVLDDKVIIAKGIPYAGTILISYEAQRTDHTDDFITISSANDFRSFFAPEEVLPTNPLPYAIMIAMVNGTPGLTIRALIVEEDSLYAHNKALSYLGLKDNIWCLVPLTQKPEILQAYAAHVTTCSEPLEKKERVVFISHKLITKDIVLLRSGSTALEYSTTGTTSAGTDVFSDMSIDFITSGVQPGDFVNILEGPLSGAYPIDNVVNAHTLSLTITINTTLSGVKYEIVSNFFDRSEIAENVQQRSMAYRNRRVCAIWPHEVYVPSPTDDAAAVAVPSYYVGAAYAALAASLPPQTPFSRMPVAGFIGLTYSNDYFTEEELDMMAAGGTWIMVQNGEGANLECRHQLTTDTTSVERREWNITKDIDYLAKTWRQTLTPLTGRNLLTDNFITVLQTYAQSLLDSAIAAGQLLAGSVLVSVERNSSATDTVDFNFKLNPPRPANTFNLYLRI